MDSNPEIPKEIQSEPPKIYKVEQENLPSFNEMSDVSSEEALLLIAKHPKAREDIFPEKLVAELKSGARPQDLFAGEFKEVVLRARKLKESTDNLQRIIEGPLRLELARAISDHLFSKYQVEIPLKLFSEFKILFLDTYRWPGFFLKRGMAVSRGNAGILPEERVIVVNTEKQWGASDITPDLDVRSPATLGKTRLTILHEFLHASSIINYWGMEHKEGEWSLGPRRLGIASGRLRGVSKEKSKIGYGTPLILRGLTEGITDILTIQIAIDKLTSVIPLETIEESSKKYYFQEADILRKINEKVPFEYFARATFQKSALKDLIEEMDKAYGKRSLETIGELMSWEKKDKEKGGDYPATRKFLTGDSISVPNRVFKRISPEFIKRNYPNIKLFEKT